MTCRRGVTSPLFFVCAKFTGYIVEIKELDLWEPMVTSYPVEGEKPKMYTISSFLIFCMRKIYRVYSRKNSLLEERHFGAGKGSNPFSFFATVHR